MPIKQNKANSSNLFRKRSKNNLSTTMAGIALFSWVFIRIGPLKISELLALLNVKTILYSDYILKRFFICYGPFIISLILSCFSALYSIGDGDNSITSEKWFYSSPLLMFAITLLRICVYLLVTLILIQFFCKASSGTISKVIDYAYLLTITPGLLQIIRIYTGFHFDIPLLERAELGPFSGVYDAGYLRIMGFETEPLAYATSIMVGICLRMHIKPTKKPIVGLIVLLHTFSAGVFIAFSVAYIIGRTGTINKYFIPTYIIFFISIGVGIYEYHDSLLEEFGMVRSISERLNAFWVCMKIWSEYPFGVGPGLYGYFMNIYSFSEFTTEVLDFYPNNDPAMFLVYGGLLLLFSYFWVFHIALKMANSKWIKISIIGILIQSLSSYLFFNPAATVAVAIALSKRSNLN